MLCEGSHGPPFLMVIGAVRGLERKWSRGGDWTGDAGAMSGVSVAGVGVKVRAGWLPWG